MESQAVPLYVALDAVVFHGHEATEPPWLADLRTGPVEVPTTAESESDSEGAFPVRSQQ